MIETIMTIEKVAKLLKVSEVTIYRQVEKGLLPGFKIGRQWRFRREDLWNFVQERSSWKQEFQCLLDEFQGKGAEKGITEKMVVREVSAVRSARRRR